MRIRYIYAAFRSMVHPAVFGALHRLPAQLAGAVFGGGAAALEVLKVPLLDILPALVPVVARAHQLLADGGVHPQESRRACAFDVRGERTRVS